jgi:hypothetical protein
MCFIEGMEATPSYDQGHLVVAAVRVLEHRNEKPPTMEEIGELLGLSHEVIGAFARALQSHDTRVEIAQFEKLEDLPREHTGAAMKSDVDAFLERSRSKKKEIDELFESGDFEKKQQEKFASLDEQLKSFQERKVVDPFASAESDKAEEPAGDDEGVAGEEEE